MYGRLIGVPKGTPASNVTPKLSFGNRDLLISSSGRGNADTGVWSRGVSLRTTDINLALAFNYLCNY